MQEDDFGFLIYFLFLAAIFGFLWLFISPIAAFGGLAVLLFLTLCALSS